MLHITNGDIAAQLVEATGIPGTVLPWRDVLHEGPVPAGLGLQELGEVRAHFLFERGWAQSSEEALREFRERDTTLQAGLAEDEIVLRILGWRRHDVTGTFVREWVAHTPSADVADDVLRAAVDALQCDSVELKLLLREPAAAAAQTVA